MSACLLLLGLYAGQVPPPPPAPISPPRGEVLTVAPTPAAVHAPTLGEFAAGFKPAAGNYEVTLLHPVTCCPVKVCFTLPCGCPKKVKVHSRELKFNYGGGCKVELHFKCDGSVKVKQS